MKIETTNRGLRILTHVRYAGEFGHPALLAESSCGEPEVRDGLEEKDERLIQESSAVGDYDDSLDNPGSSYLWVGRDHHLDRDQVRELIGHMNAWLTNGRLPDENDAVGREK